VGHTIFELEGSKVLTRRRNTPRRRMTPLAVFVGALMVLTACGSGGSDAEDFDSASVDLEATLNVADRAAPTSFDPHRIRNTGEDKHLFLVWDRLLMVDDLQQLQPGLATEWTFSADETELTLVLRDNVEFHDGTPVDAASVKASLERAMTLEGSTVAASLKAIVDTVDVEADGAVKISLKTPAPHILQVLATGAGAVISKKAIDDGVDIGTDPNSASSGAYELTDFVPNNSSTLTRREGEYWDADAAKIKTIHIKLFGDSNSMMSALKTGQVDLAIPSIAEQDLEAAVAGTQIQTDVYATAGLNALFINPKQIDDPRIREAIIRGIDRHAIATQLLGGDDMVSDQIDGRTAPTFIEDYDYPFAYDPVRAEELLKEAGVEDGFTLDLMVPAGISSSESAALAAQANLKEIGIEVSIRPVPAADGTATWQEGQTQSMISVIPGQATPYLQVNRVWKSVYQVADPQLGTELDEAMASVAAAGLSDDQRVAASQELVSTALSQATFVPVAYRTGVFAFHSKVLNVDSMPGRWAADSACELRYLAVAKAL